MCPQVRRQTDHQPPVNDIAQTPGELVANRERDLRGEHGPIRIEGIAEVRFRRRQFDEPLNATSVDIDHPPPPCIRQTLKRQSRGFRGGEVQRSG